MLHVLKLTLARQNETLDTFYLAFIGDFILLLIAWPLCKEHQPYSSRVPQT